MNRWVDQATGESRSAARRTPAGRQVADPNGQIDCSARTGLCLGDELIPFEIESMDRQP